MKAITWPAEKQVSLRGDLSKASCRSLDAGNAGNTGSVLVLLAGALISKERLPKLLLEVLKPGGVFCACENAERSQNGVRLLPLFFREMETLGFYQLHLETKHFEGCDDEHTLFKFGRSR